MSFLDKPTLSADNGSFFQKNLDYQIEKPTLSEINLLYLIIVTTACHKRTLGLTNFRYNEPYFWSLHHEYPRYNELFRKLFHFFLILKSLNRFSFHRNHLFLAELIIKNNRLSFVIYRRRLCVSTGDIRLYKLKKPFVKKQNGPCVYNAFPQNYVFG